MKILNTSFFLISIAILSWISNASRAQSVASPNNNVQVEMVSNDITAGKWALSVNHITNGKTVKFGLIQLGLDRNDQSFSENLVLKSVSKPVLIRESYNSPHGKSSARSQQATEVIFEFLSKQSTSLRIIVRAYNDGLAFRYAFPLAGKDKFTIKDEQTAFVPEVNSQRWMQKFVTSYEGFYPEQKDGIIQGEWGYPALLKLGGEQSNSWALITEADLSRDYCATKLSNNQNINIYKLELPATTDGNGKGEVQPEISMPWVSPWRVVILGSLGKVFESTLVEDVSSPSKISKIEWIKPGLSSWVYWANNHGTKDLKSFVST